MVGAKFRGLNQQQEKALLLWFNSSMSFLLFFGRRVVTEGAFIKTGRTTRGAIG
jgi:hypothetical protein